ncbi:L-histidine N(alpha)-methyltransferase [Streptomyces gardneri]|uniref:L-histidine N(alpha)-methyltransferase n=1 Tax=Nocardia TaxID=1817 RepID=UPI00135CCB76|nr:MULTISPECIES: L-histidine N(alpha)-methyltransferase [Nocardia]MBF6168596.1 L-histidine N(alpha)-methyltransferase [Streptomyces gardneri]MBF6208855.1 L-histidine N(alpha)-methyltransferase [Streptomyces gardneri]UAK31412.1 L-histidine N(alpha)-methyltransferase [Nocardia asteroides]
MKNFATSNETLHATVVRGLTSSDKYIPTTWVFDTRGGDLYEHAITVPEYYLSVAETRLLTVSVAGIADATRARTLIDLGCGAASKCRPLLEQLHSRGLLTCYVAWDINEDAVAQSVEFVSAAFPAVAIESIVEDFHESARPLSFGNPQLAISLGCTFGNLSPGERHALFSSLCRRLGASGSLLIGADLLKNTDKLLGAYDGTAPSDLWKNALVRANAELDADFDLDNFVYHKQWNAAARQVDHYLRATTSHKVSLRRMGATIGFARNELIKVAHSAKMSALEWTQELETASYTVQRWWIDDRDTYGLCLAQAQPFRG